MFNFLNIYQVTLSGLGSRPLEAQFMWDDINGLPYFQGGKAGRTGCQARFAFNP
jgi:hypothetical protein